VLDVGCGHGEVALELAPLCRSILAYDRVQPYIQLAKDAARIRHNCAVHCCLTPSPEGESFMNQWKINLNDVPEEHQLWSWRNGNYERFRRQVSVALGNTRDNPHPFDVELTRLPPGARPCPIHSHSYRWEFFIIVSGQAIVQREGESIKAVKGDCFMQPAGTRHRIRNASETEDLVYYVIASEHEEKDSGHPFEI
jgi:mannose-6-phosphate isomerase-like protein (cupin superfamily)